MIFSAILTLRYFLFTKPTLRHNLFSLAVFNLSPLAKKIRVTLLKKREAKSKKLKTFYLDADISRINFSHYQRKMQFF